MQDSWKPYRNLKKEKRENKYRHCSLSGSVLAFMPIQFRLVYFFQLKPALSQSIGSPKYFHITVLLRVGLYVTSIQHWFSKTKNQENSPGVSNAFFKNRFLITHERKTR